jgi:hypothetical protein
MPHWQAWCAAALFLVLLYWLTRARKPKKRLPGHKHYCPVCQKEFTCLDDDCTSYLLKEHPGCESSYRSRRDRAA